MTLNLSVASCPGENCALCPRSGCICPPCGCTRCRERERKSKRVKTSLRARAATPVRERLFDPEPNPIGDRR